MLSINLLQQLLQLSSDGITDLNSSRLSADVASSDTSLSDVSDCFFDDACLGGFVKGVLEQHGHGQDGSNGVDDSLSSNIRGGALFRQYTYDFPI